MNKTDLKTKIIRIKRNYGRTIKERQSVNEYLESVLSIIFVFYSFIRKKNVALNF